MKLLLSFNQNSCWSLKNKSSKGQESCFLAEWNKSQNCRAGMYLQGYLFSILRYSLLVSSLSQVVHKRLFNMLRNTLVCGKILEPSFVFFCLTDSSNNLHFIDSEAQRIKCDLCTYFYPFPLYFSLQMIFYYFRFCEDLKVTSKQYFYFCSVLLWGGFYLKKVPGKL